MKHSTWVIRLLSIATIAAAPDWMQAQVTLIGIGTLPGNSSDLSGLNGKFQDGTPWNRLGGLGSAIAYSGKSNRYVLASDRGPKDGAIDYPCRIHMMDITVDPESKNPVQLKLASTTLLTNEMGQSFSGALSMIDKKNPEKSRRLDPEGVRVGPKGEILIADEYGPSLYEFDTSGKRTQTYPIPAKFLPAKISAKPDDELPPKNLMGRQPNRGMEGLAISPDGSKLIGIMQSPLIQDGGVDGLKQRVGINCRILEVNRSTGKTREFVYQLENPGLGVSEILALNDYEYLVLERDGKANREATFKKVFKIDTRMATEISLLEKLPALKLPQEIMPVTKTLFIDLLDRSLKLVGTDLPEKFEGMTFGPDLPDGRRLLLITADNDFIASSPLRIYAFAVDKP
jgi:hypothetical protein